MDETPIAGPSSEPAHLPRKRKKNNPKKVHSIYALPTRARLGRALLRDKSKKRAVPPAPPVNDEEGSINVQVNGDGGAQHEHISESQKVRAAHHERTVKGWETRGARDKSRDASLSLEIEQLLPDDDLLRALQYHAMEFYTKFDLLIPPRKQIRTVQWRSKKRMLLDAEGVDTSASNGDEVQSTQGGPSWVVLSEDEDALGEEYEDFNKDEQEEDSDIQEESGMAQTDKGKGREMVNGKQPQRKSTLSGKQVRSKRDVYKSLDGSALIALGVLVEEHISRELHRGGHKPPAESGTESNEPGDGYLPSKRKRRLKKAGNDS